MSLLAAVKNLRLHLALRFRPAASLERLLSRGLARVDPDKEGIYSSFTRKQIEKELRWIDHWHIDDSHYFDLMSLYPALQRAFFIHIPKCGGTSIRQQLVTTYAMGPIPLSTEGAVDQAISFMQAPTYHRGNFLQSYLKGFNPEDQRRAYLRAYAGFIITAAPKRLFVLGHQRARELTPLYRESSDLMFTTVREPLELLRSMVTYRISHTLKTPQRLDSVQLLEAMECDHSSFVSLMNTDPRALVERVLRIKPPSLTSYLAMDERMDYDTVWRGIKQRSLFIAHLSEQAQMLTRLFGMEPREIRKNAAKAEDGEIGEFAARLQDEWIKPFVDPDSITLYKRLETTGIIGFWRKGGTLEEYLDILQKN